MTRMIKRRVVVMGCLAVLILAGDLVVVPLAFDARPLCERASDWVEAHRGALPATLDELAAFPVAYRSAIQSALPADTQARLWSEQLRTLSGSAHLTPHQRNTVREVLALVSPNLYVQESRFDGLREETQRIVAVKVERAFGTSEVVEAFRVLGAAEPVASVGRAGLVQLSEGVRGLFATDAAQTPNCQCSSPQDCNRPGRIPGPCTFGNCNVVYTCGFLANLGCGGRCLG